MAWVSEDRYLTQSEQENNANIIINYYRGLGINDKTIAAILGNMQAESTLSPVLTERGGGGGYSGMMKNMLVKLGWDGSKIYDVGGYWFYEGENSVKVKRLLDDGSVVYDFYKVPYHEIDFETLTEI